MPSKPETSILLSVLNGERTLNRCLKSIRDQTYTNYELIVVNDGATDNTPILLTRWRIHFGERLRIITHSESAGLTTSLNEAIENTRGNWIARIDADDWWHKDKLQIQTHFMQSHPHIGIVGTWYQNIETNQRRTIKLPTQNESIKKSMYKQNPFGHSTVLMRKEVIAKAGGYDQCLQFGQDRDLWFRLLHQTNFANIPQVLCYRDISASSTNKHKQIIQNLKTTSKYIRLHRAPLTQYLHLAEPLAVLITPRKIRQKIRQLRSQ